MHIKYIYVVSDKTIPLSRAKIIIEDVLFQKKKKKTLLQRT